MQHERSLTLPSLKEIAKASYLSRALNISKDSACLTPPLFKITHVLFYIIALSLNSQLVFIIIYYLLLKGLVFQYE